MTSTAFTGIQYTAVLAALFSLALLAGGCDRTDIGEDCPGLLGDTPPAITTQDGETVTQEVVAQDVSFPCDNLLCIASQGIAGYCSKKCLGDGACPSGFSCRAIQAKGDEFGGQLFCAWKTCKKRSDCGKTENFCCEEVLNADPVETLKLCRYSNEGKCG